MFTLGSVSPRPLPLPHFLRLHRTLMAEMIPHVDLPSSEVTVTELAAKVQHQLDGLEPTVAQICTDPSPALRLYYRINPPSRASLSLSFILHLLPNAGDSKLSAVWSQIASLVPVIDFIPHLSAAIGQTQKEQERIGEYRILRCDVIAHD